MVDHGERGGWNSMFCNSMSLNEYNMLVPHGQIRVEHDRVQEMINDVFIDQGGINPKSILMKILMKMQDTSMIN